MPPPPNSKGYFIRVQGAPHPCPFRVDDTVTFFPETFEADFLESQDVAANNSEAPTTADVVDKLLEHHDLVACMGACPASKLLRLVKSIYYAKDRNDPNMSGGVAMPCVDNVAEPTTRIIEPQPIPNMGARPPLIHLLVVLPTLHYFVTTQGRGVATSCVLFGRETIQCISVESFSLEPTSTVETLLAACQQYHDKQCPDDNCSTFSEHNLNAAHFYCETRSRGPRMHAKNLICAPATLSLPILDMRIRDDRIPLDPHIFSGPQGVQPLHLVIVLSQPALLKRQAEEETPYNADRDGKRPRRMSASPSTSNPDGLPRLEVVGDPLLRLWRYSSRPPSVGSSFMQDQRTQAEGDPTDCDTLFIDITSAPRDLIDLAYDAEHNSTIAEINHPACATVEQASYLLDSIAALFAIQDEDAWAERFASLGNHRPEGTPVFYFKIIAQNVQDLAPEHLLDCVQDAWHKYGAYAVDEMIDEEILQSSDPSVLLEAILKIMKKHGHRLFFAAKFSIELLDASQEDYEAAEELWAGIAEVLSNFSETAIVLSIAPCSGLNLLFVSGKYFNRRPTNLLCFDTFVKHLGFSQEQVEALVPQYSTHPSANQLAARILKERCRVPYGPDNALNTRSYLYPRRLVVHVLKALSAGPSRLAELADSSDLEGFPRVPDRLWNNVMLFANAAGVSGEPPHSILKTLIRQSEPKPVEIVPNAVGASLAFDKYRVTRYISRLEAQQHTDAAKIEINCLFFFLVLKAYGLCDVFYEPSGCVVAAFVNSRVGYRLQSRVALWFDPRRKCVHDVLNDPQVNFVDWLTESTELELSSRDTSMISAMKEKDMQVLVMDLIIGIDYRIGTDGISKPLMEVKVAPDPGPTVSDAQIAFNRIDGVIPADTRLNRAAGSVAENTLVSQELKNARLQALLEGTYGIKILANLTYTERQNILTGLLECLRAGRDELQSSIQRFVDASIHETSGALRQIIKNSKLEDRNWNGSATMDHPLDDKGSWIGPTPKLQELYYWFPEDNRRHRVPVTKQILEAMAQGKEYPEWLGHGRVGSKDLLTWEDSVGPGHTIRSIVQIFIGGVSFAFEMPSVTTNRIYKWLVRARSNFER
ncbi:hypothetical protein HMN09_00892700 [Mycena chlorophos]|uniref:Uncharacterized protein n=1 Tax=Mycena chlorophos TaxID=658473 RepID=A0A8H6W2I2_MYCCL|nr:hypothetical protein HMN09_00892700 [Mycena chlorophos]